MPTVEVAEVMQAFAADGGPTGYVQVASSAGFYAGCLGFIRATGLGARVMITEIPDATHVGVRIYADDNEKQGPIQVYGGRSNLTGYTMAAGATLSMERQLARVEEAWVPITKPNI